MALEEEHGEDPSREAGEAGQLSNRWRCGGRGSDRVEGMTRRSHRKVDRCLGP